MKVSIKFIVAYSALGLLGLAFGLFLYGLYSSPVGDKVTPSGLKRNTSQYVTMSDGASIAVDIWFPASLQAGEKIPVLTRFTRYIRAMEPGLIARAARGLGFDGVHPVLDMFNRNGYAVALIDARGSGASSGARKVEIGPKEVTDMGEVVDWLSRQSWSNGSVGAFGVSYVGTTSEMLTASNHSSVKAIAPLFSDFDGYTGLVRPGGVSTVGFSSQWGGANVYRDKGDVCMGEEGVKCFFIKLWRKGIKPVDDDQTGKKLADILRSRSHYVLSSQIEEMIYLDDPITEDGILAQDIFPIGYKDQINRSRIPMQVWVGWLDAATVDGAIARYNSFANPQELIIGPYNHGGQFIRDPLGPVAKALIPDLTEQYQERLDFFDKYLKNTHGNALTDVPPKNVIRYYTLGEGRWKTTDTWPPAGIFSKRFYFAEQGRLTVERPVEAEATEQYKVDYSATTGTQNRWYTQLGGRDVVYPDRAQEDRKLLTFTSDPLNKDTEITGVPVVTIQFSSTHSDGAFHVYLEDVAPDGRVTYLTEGVMRALHRKLSEETPPYYIEGPYHSYKRENGQALIPGEPAELKVGLITTSVMIKKGHRIRIAIAGHDASTFERIPRWGTPEITLYRGTSRSSYVDLPVASQD